MYTKPTLQQFGSFRDLTQWGFTTDGDIGAIIGIGGCVGTREGCDAPTNRS